MSIGLAGALLVFTGVWHATEWLMDGRRPDTMRLIPVGFVYALLGCLLVMGVGGVITQIVALILVIAGGSVAFLRRDQFDVRKWVIWSFVVVDVIIALALLSAVLF